MRSRGFTLVEMLVAMVAFSLVAAAAAGILNLSLRNASAFEETDGATRQLQIARTIMRADFAQIARRPVRDTYGAAIPAVFVGGAGEAGDPMLRFVRHGWDNPDGAEERSSLQYIEYAVEGGALVRRTRPYLDPTPDTPVTATTLISDVRGVTVSFLSRGQWSDKWLAANVQGALPDAVALEMKVAAAGGLRQAFLVEEP